MKKIFLTLFTIVLTMVFVTCSGSKKSDAPAQEPNESGSVESVVPSTPETAVSDSVVAPPKSATEMLKEFQAYAKAYGEANNNVAKDPNKFIELGRQSQKWVNDMEQIKGELNKKQLQDYEKALDIVRKVNKIGK